MAFNAVDIPGNEFHVVVLKAGYELIGRTPDPQNPITHECVLLEGDDALPLVMADEYEGEVGLSSVREESDLAPFKPACDVIVRATAHAPGGTPAASWEAGLWLWDRSRCMIEKSIGISGPRVWASGLFGWSLSRATPIVTLPVRWEYAFGGRSYVESKRDSGDVLINEACFSNPIGCGWIERRFPALATHKESRSSTDVLQSVEQRDGVGFVRAAQIESMDKPQNELVVARHPEEEADAFHMSTIASNYGVSPVGLGVVGRAWAPRLALAGTYDDEWLRARWPYLPQNFDFRYWNSAPADQQIPWPQSDFAFELINLAHPSCTLSGHLIARLPGHRAVTALRLANGAIFPVQMPLDTIVIDAEQMRVSLTWRAIFPLTPEVRVCEARFETDPTAPLLRYADNSFTHPERKQWQTT